MNLNTCQGCHVNPAIGGTSPATNNPQVSFYRQSLNHTTNSLPKFITATGPVREARFPSDGGVHDLFTIAGMTGAVSCKLSQPNFAQAMAANNLIFRIPTPLFGAGLIEQIQTRRSLQISIVRPPEIRKRLTGFTARQISCCRATRYRDRSIKMGTTARSAALDGRRRTSLC